MIGPREGHMGAWGYRAFDNDTANDWASDLDDHTDLRLVREALVNALQLDLMNDEAGAIGLAACEVVARLVGRPGYSDSYTIKVDQWVAANPQKVAASLLEQALAVTARVLSEEDSELAELWEGNPDWVAAVRELEHRLRR